MLKPNAAEKTITRKFLKGVQRIVSEGPILNITKLNRDDAGVYTCEAINSQGSDMINITVVVECK